MVKFEGKYKRTKEENYNEFLTKMKVGMLMRKAATVSTPTMEISQTSPGKWKIVTATTLKSMELNFELGVAFDEKTTDGRTCKTTVTQTADDTWVTKQIAQKDGEKNAEVIRKFTDEGIDVQMICEDVVSKQFFERIA